jgi:hypothetical protein
MLYLPSKPNSYCIWDLEKYNMLFYVEQVYCFTALLLFLSLLYLLCSFSVTLSLNTISLSLTLLNYCCHSLTSFNTQQHSCLILTQNISTSLIATTYCLPFFIISIWIFLITCHYNIRLILSIAVTGSSSYLDFLID